MHPQEFGPAHEAVKYVQHEFKNERFLVAHSFKAPILESLVQLGYCVIFVVRDPRDQLISMLNWIREGERPENPVTHIEDINEQIEELITGKKTGWKCVEVIFLDCERELANLPSESVYFLHYEDLVGPKAVGI